MADYRLISYQLKPVQKQTQEGHPYEVLLLALKMENGSGNEDVRAYMLCGDIVYNIETLKNVISNGLEDALEKNMKIGISDYEERTYVTLTLPSRSNTSNQKRTNYRITAHKQ